MVADTFDWGIFAAPEGTERKRTIQASVTFQEEDPDIRCMSESLSSLNRDYLGEMVANHFNEKESQGIPAGRILPDHVYRALFAMKQQCSSTDDYFYLFASLNLLNAAIKTPEWKRKLSYNAIKGRVSDFFRMYATNSRMFQGIRAYYNVEDKVAYVKIYGVIFSFHYIPVDRTIEQFASSNRNVPMTWNGVRLQKIADWLYEKAASLSELSASEERRYERWKEGRIARETCNLQGFQASQRIYAA